MRSNSYIPPVIGLQERAERNYKEGETYYFCFRGKVMFGVLKGDITDDPNEEVYIHVELDEVEYDRRGNPITHKYYMIKKDWLLDPSDLLGLMN